jgi:hypothetical protein
MDIVSFDGENYTINETISVPLRGTSQNYSFTVKMNKAGYTTTTYTSGLPAGTSQPYSQSNFIGGVGTLFQKNQAKVGETWQVPMSLGNSSLGFTGNLTLTFGNIQDITVPPGTYRVFRIDVAGSNLTMSPTVTGVSNFVNMSINDQEYFEYGTCKPIDFNLEENVSYRIGAQNSTMNLYMLMMLVRDSKH